MVPMMRLPVLILVATVGCATLAGPPPTPPVATLLPGSPKEYKWSPVKWKPGATLTYINRQYMELKAGDRQQAEHSHSVLRLKATERTARGHMRVQLSVDGTDLGFVLVDEAGRFVDAVASSPELGELFKAFVQWMDHALLGPSKAGVLRIGESFRVEYPSSIGLSLYPQAWRGSLNETIVFNNEFIGYARLGEKMVVGFRFEMPEILRSTVWGSVQGSKERYQINTLTGSGIVYRDPAGGFIVSSYSESTALGFVGRQQIVFRNIEVSELDWQNSSGF